MAAAPAKGILRNRAAQASDTYRESSVEKGPVISFSKEVERQMCSIYNIDENLGGKTDLFRLSSRAFRRAGSLVCILAAVGDQALAVAHVFEQ